MASIEVVKGGGGGIAIGDTITGATQGSIFFAGVGGVLSQDNANLFWDDTNNRLGIGTSAPTSALQIGDGISGTNTFNLTGNISTKQKILFSSNGNIAFQSIASHANNGDLDIITNSNIRFGNSNTQNGELTSEFCRINSTGVGIGTTSPTARLHIKGSGTTSATTSLSVQNSAGTELLRVLDNGTFERNSFNFSTNSNIGDFLSGNDWNSYNISNGSIKYKITGASFGFGISDVGYDTVAASSMLQVNSTTKGFLPPRMTTAQKNAISSPANGLVVFDTTLNKLAVYTTIWETVTSI
jgi:hypothetical protein